MLEIHGRGDTELNLCPFCGRDLRVAARPSARPPCGGKRGCPYPNVSHCPAILHRVIKWSVEAETSQFPEPDFKSLNE